MAHYYLPNPKNSSDILLQKGQAWDEPIYKGKDSNDYYLLRLGLGLTRYLIPFDPNTATIGIEQYPVPSNWTGEPQIFTITEDAWNDICERDERGDSSVESTIEEIRKLLADGDVVRLTQNGRVSSRLVYRRRGREWSITAE